MLDSDTNSQKSEDMDLELDSLLRELAGIEALIKAATDEAVQAALEARSKTTFTSVPTITTKVSAQLNTNKE